MLYAQLWWLVIIIAISKHTAQLFKASALPAHPGAHLPQLFCSVALIPKTFRCLPNLAVT